MARGNEMTTTKMVEFRKDRMVVYKGKTYNPGELVELPVEDVEYLLAKKLVTEKSVSKK